MKKITIFLAAALCVFGLTACGESKQLTEYENSKVSTAETVAKQIYVPVLNNMVASYAQEGDDIAEEYSEYTMDEIAYFGETIIGQYIYYTMGQQMEFKVDGYGFYNSVISFNSAYATLGSIVEYGEATSVIDDNQIVVNIPVVCENGEANVEVIVSNDLFLSFKSATINQNYTMGEKMEKAALNTLIGISTVFIVLILICLLISCFGIIPKIQKSIADGKAAKEAEKSATEKSIDNAVNQIIANETVDESDDLELVAVIAAAIAAYEGSATTDGYVVRSIRRRR